MSPISYTPSFQPTFDEDIDRGWRGDFNQNGGLKKLRPLRESERRTDMEEIAFDDTHKLMSVNRDRLIESRLREDNANSYGSEDYGHGSSARSTPAKASPGHFQRGVPTNDTSSAKNYGPDHVRIIKGEHVTLLKNGAMNEAIDGDDHDGHILEHRYMLSNPNLTETMRSSLLEHLTQHIKMKKKGMKQVQEDLGEQAKRRFGPGVASRLAARQNGGSDSKIPQDSLQSKERKRTAGMISMEAGGRGRGPQDRYQAALKIRRGL